MNQDDIGMVSDEIAPTDNGIVAHANRQRAPIAFQEEIMMR